MSSSPHEPVQPSGSLLVRMRRAVLRPIDWRFDNVAQRLISHTAILHNQELEAVNAHSRVLEEATDSFGQTLREESHTLVDLTVALERRADRLERIAESLSGGSHRLPRNLPLAEMDPELTEYLDWAASYQGPLADRSIWFNRMLDVRYSGGGHVVGVNERVVEVPYVHSRLLALPEGSRVLDFGATESEFSLVAASLGYLVTTVDLRPYPLDHPNLTGLVGPAEDLDDPDEPFDMIVSLSALEHVGLGSYGEAEKTLNLDGQLVEKFRSWLRPGGTFVLTVPFGNWEVTPTQRIYDDAHLDVLLDGWDVLDRRVVRRRSDTVWTPRRGDEIDPPQVGHDVLLATLTPR